MRSPKFKCAEIAVTGRFVHISFEPHLTGVTLRLPPKFKCAGISVTGRLVHISREKGQASIIA